MRSSILTLCLATLIASPVLATVVVHDAAPGIVAASFRTSDYALDHNGFVWELIGTEWDRAEHFDPPIPVGEIRFWDYVSLFSVDNEYWEWVASNVWINRGPWPGVAGLIENDPEPNLDPAVSPNPRAGLCQISFRVPSEGEVSVKVIDTGGRIVRRLMSGPHPAGEYRLEWDGTDDNGREMPAGVYLTQIKTGENVRGGRIVLAR